jgi:hypothetical protein
VYLGIEGTFDLPHHNIHIAADYARNLDEIENQHVLSGDPSFYVQNASVTDPTLAPRGMSTLYVLTPVTHQHGNVDRERQRDRFRALVLKQIGKAGFVDVEERIRYERVITPSDWDRQYEIHKGATFNLAHSLDQMLHLRPHNRFQDLDGVYLVGGGTHPGKRPAGNLRVGAHQHSTAFKGSWRRTFKRASLRTAACGDEFGARMMITGSDAECDLVRVSLAEARDAQASWALQPMHVRIDFLRELRHLVAGHATELASRAAAVSGRPVAEKLASEVLPLAEACLWLERRMSRVLAPRRCGKESRPSWMCGISFEVQRQPFGVVLVIGPANYPLFLPAVQALHALAAANAVLLKPAPQAERRGDSPRRCPGIEF